MNNFRSLAVWIIIALLLFALFSLFQGQTQRMSSSDVSYSEFLSKVDSGEVKSVTISGDSITGQYTNGTGFQTYAPQDPDLIDPASPEGRRDQSAVPPAPTSSCPASSSPGSRSCC